MQSPKSRGQLPNQRERSYAFENFNNIQWCGEPGIINVFFRSVFLYRTASVTGWWGCTSPPPTRTWQWRRRRSSTRSTHSWSAIACKDCEDFASENCARCSVYLSTCIDTSKVCQSTNHNSTLLHIAIQFKKILFTKCLGKFIRKLHADMRRGRETRPQTNTLNTWPLLSYFWHRYLVEFQFVDMRWGWEIRPQTTTWTHDLCCPIFAQIPSGVSVRKYEVGDERRYHRQPHEHMVTFVLFLAHIPSEVSVWGHEVGVRDEATDNHMNLWQL